MIISLSGKHYKIIVEGKKTYEELQNKIVSITYMTNFFKKRANLLEVFYKNKEYFNNSNFMLI